MKLKLAVLFSLLLSGAVVTSTAVADGVLPVQNASFETTNALDISCATGPETCAYNVSGIPGWTTTPVSGSWEPSSAYFNLPLPDGNIVAFTNGTISQTLTGTTLQPDSSYTLSVYVGNRLDYSSPAAFEISLYAGSTLLGSLDGSTASIASGAFADELLTYSTGSTVTPGDLAIVLSSSGTQIDFDDVQLTDPSNDVPVSTPEPSGFALLGLGLLGMAVLSFKERRHFSAAKRS